MVTILSHEWKKNNLNLTLPSFCLLKIVSKFTALKISVLVDLIPVVIVVTAANDQLTYSPAKQTCVVLRKKSVSSNCNYNLIPFCIWLEYFSTKQQGTVLVKGVGYLAEGLDVCSLLFFVLSAHYDCPFFFHYSLATFKTCPLPKKIKMPLLNHPNDEATLCHMLNAFNMKQW